MKKLQKIIIENRTNAPMEVVLKLVSRVIDKGKISNKGKQYCRCVGFETEDWGEITIFTDLNKCSDRFVAIQIKK